MRKLINFIVKYAGYLGIYLLTLIESFIISVVGMGSLLSIVLAVWSFITPLPAIFTDSYGVALLTASLIPSVILFIYIIVHLDK